MQPVELFYKKKLSLTKTFGKTKTFGIFTEKTCVGVSF